MERQTKKCSTSPPPAPKELEAFRRNLSKHLATPGTMLRRVASSKTRSPPPNAALQREYIR
ncbi:hypothetical protein [Pendulispora albinea]|uniref:Uncharacterized protein n=1 Tax=Pendulispora albinea TaxID=2741071 RepID=A0ABZ2M740_9BACT